MILPQTTDIISSDPLSSLSYCLDLEFLMLFHVSLQQWWSYEDIIINKASVQIRAFKEVVFWIGKILGEI